MTAFDKMVGDLDQLQWDHLLMLADSAEEDDQLTLALGLRWLAQHQRWPLAVNDHWEWWIDRTPRRVPKNKALNRALIRFYGCCLPKEILLFIRNQDTELPSRHECCAAAILEAAKVIGTLIESKSHKQLRLPFEEISKY